MWGRARSWFLSGMLLLLTLGALNRILTDKSAPGMIGGFLSGLSSLFTSTING